VPLERLLSLRLRILWWLGLLPNRRTKMRIWNGKANKPFEPTPWLVVAIVLLAITVTSLIDNCGSW
jgi:hypothetical protein